MQPFTCPCCGYKVFLEEPGSYEICPVCKWEDDETQLRFVTTVGANKESLQERQLKTIINSQEAQRYEKDPAWKPLVETNTEIEVPIRGKEYGETYPSDYKKLYYWLNM